MAGVPPAQVRSYERLREITSVCERLRVLGGLSGAGFAGFFGIFGMAGVPPAQVRSYERLREITSVCERFLRVLGGLSEAGFAGFFWIFRMGEDLLTQVSSYERTSVGREIACVYERSRVFACVYECCGRVCLEQDLQDFLGFSGWRGSAGSGALVRALDERLRAFTRDSDRSSEGTGRSAGDCSVGLPAKAGQWGYFSEFFHKNVRFVRSKACFAFDFGLFRVDFHVVDRFAQRGQAARLTLAGPTKGTKFHEENRVAGRRPDE